jgi:hypothetical protein
MMMGMKPDDKKEMVMETMTKMMSEMRLMLMKNAGATGCRTPKRGDERDSTP